MSEVEEPFDFDLFISHASEDQQDFVEPLVERLEAKGFRVWYSETALKLGDSLRRSIGEGLKRSRFGVVVLSPKFLAKEWPNRELDALFSLEENGPRRILPIWHGVTQDEVVQSAPFLADRLAVDSNEGLGVVVERIVEAVNASPATAVVPEPELQARWRRISNERLRLRNLDLASDDYCQNDDSRALLLELNGCQDSRPNYTILSLVPIDRFVNLDTSNLWDWVHYHRGLEPLSADDIRPRGQGVILRSHTVDGQLARYLLIESDGYVEWGRTFVGCYDGTIRLLRLGPLLWAVRHLLEFLGKLKEDFKLRTKYELVVSIHGASGSVLSHLGEGWPEPWERGYRQYRPMSKDDRVQFRKALPIVLQDGVVSDIVKELDQYLNRVWGDRQLRGHNRLDGSLPNKYRYDPWEPYRIAMP